MVGSVIENYKIVSVLGEGGMGIVYKGFDLKLERYIALKILNQQALKNPQFIERFKREAKNQAKLTHPNIVPVYGFTEGNGLLGIVMEYIAGETLEHLIERKGKLTVPEAVTILKQALTAISYAHSKGFVHRDLKPSNIIISLEGVVKIMDFGISKSMNEVRGITKTGTKIGTVLYMSPEQIKAQEPTPQSDVYSLGITLYEMLSGKTPFEAPTDFHIMEGHLKRNPTKLSSKFENIPPVIDTILGKSLSKSTSRRYHSCDAFLADINSVPMVHYQSKKTLKNSKNSEVNAGFDSEEFFRKLKNYSLTALVIVVFVGIFYFVYNSVSDFWINKDYSPKVVDDGTNTYRSNPAYLTRSDWKTISGPTKNNLNSVFFVNDSIGYACGNDSTIIKSVNGGKRWTTLCTSDTGIILNGIRFLNLSNGVAVGEKGTILITSDGGTNWKKVNADVYESLFGVYFIRNSSIGFIVGAGGTILKTVDGGNSWRRILSPTQNLLYNVTFSSDADGFAVGWNGDLLKTSDQGNTWIKSEKFSDVYFRDISFANDELGLIVGGGGEIYRTDNGGNDWEKINLNLITGLYSVSFLDKSNGLILGSKGEILVTDDGGKKWKATSSGKFGALTGLSVLPSGKVIVVGVGGIIISSL